MDASINSSGTSCSTSMNNPDNAAAFVPRSVPAHGLLREMGLLHKRFMQTHLAVIMLACANREQTELPGELVAWCRATLLTCDSVVTLGAGRIALLLPGAGAFKAQALAEELLEQAPQSALGVGVASGGEECQDHPDTLIRQADQALDAALRDGQSLRVYRQPKQTLEHRKTLVHSDEKRFLFSGGN